MERLLFPVVLAITFGVSAHVRLEFRADSGAYFAYLRSAVFDGDLDFANEWEKWGWEEGRRTSTGLVHNAQSVGPRGRMEPCVSGNARVLGDRPNAHRSRAVRAGRIQ